MATYPADSDQQQAAVGATHDLDAFNWGYDPFHYTVPEGSYSANPDGPTRILEFREMVQAINQMGLRVVMDVVYNHTKASGLLIREASAMKDITFTIFLIDSALIFMYNQIA